MIQIIKYGLAVLICLTAHPLFAYTSEDCVRCHGTGSGESMLQIPLKGYEASIHGEELSCPDCHAGVTDESHTMQTGLSGVDCGSCHEQKNRHGSGPKEETRPMCHSCHGMHTIQPKDNKASWVHPENLERTCGACHPEQTGKADLFPWLTSLQARTHGKEDFSSLSDRGDCLGCHQGMGAHGEETPVNDRNCPICHMTPEGRSLLWGSIHPVSGEDPGESYRISKMVYIAAAILFLLGGFVFCIGGRLPKGGGK